MAAKRGPIGGTVEEEGGGGFSMVLAVGVLVEKSQMNAL